MMLSSSVFLLGALLLIMVFSIAWLVWLLVRHYSQRLSRIDDELRAITAMLSEMPGEASLQEYMFSQDQRLLSIREKLDTHPDPALMQRYIQEHTEQLNTIIYMLGERSKTDLAKADLVDSLRITNESLEKVLWSLRFDEGKYAQENTPTIEKQFAQPGNARVKSINMSEWYGLLRINCR